MADTTHNVLSITKAVIGLLYRVYKVDESEPFLTDAGPGVRIKMVLDHQGGMHDDDSFQYDSFRQAYERGEDMFEYAKQNLASQPRPGEFGYSNLAWQILARRFHDLTGVHCNAALEKMIGAGGWTWECDATGCPLGPHGIEMDTLVACKIARLADTTLQQSDFVSATDADFWPFEELPSPRYVCNGWFAVKSPVFLMYAAGFQSQYIVVTDSEYTIQLRGQSDADFDLERPPPDNERLLIKRLLQERALRL